MPAVYRSRDPRKTPLYRLLEAHYEPVKLQWEQRFEARYGFFCGFWDQAVARYLDCGVWDNGFARIRCDACRHEMLVAFSCKQRGLCPSCSAKRGAELGAFLIEHVKEDVGHAQWVFTIPKMLRPLFFKVRHLRGHLAQMAWETVRDLMAAAVEVPDLRPGMVAVIQSFGDRVNPHPHVHALVTRGGWTRDDQFLPIPFVDPGAAQRLFQHKVLTLLQREDLITPERVALLLSWKHTGFSVHNSVRIAPDDTDGLEALVRYIMRPPVSLARLRLLPGGNDVLHFPKRQGDDPGQATPERVEAMEYVARVLSQVPEPRKHQVRYYGFYSCAARGKRNKGRQAGRTASDVAEQAETEAPPQTAVLRKRWADLLRRVYEADPLVCPRCGAPMRVVSFITQPAVIRRILKHLKTTQRPVTRPPPPRPRPVLATP
jgi:ribosomal protein L34E